MFSRFSPYRTLLSLSAGILLLNPVQAQDFDNRANIYGGVNHYRFDNDWKQDNDFGWFIGGEVPLAERWALTLENWNLDSDREQIPGEAEFDYRRLGTNYLLTPINEWQPYLGIGAGHLKRDFDIPNVSDSETAYDFGVGVKRFFNDNLFLRGDIKALKVTGVSNLDMAVNVGFGYAFGPKSRPVAAAPMPAPDPDSDGDGVPDSRDKCPNTPRELAVDADGCPIMDSSMARQELLVNFDFDKSEIKPEFYAEIARFAEFMTTYANTSVVIEGHTDSDGSDEYNQGLSERRARAIVARLISAHNIAPARLTAVGYGEKNPVVENNSRANKARNRRIMAEASVQIQQQRRR